MAFGLEPIGSLAKALLILNSEVEVWFVTI
ncbi:hypothetical protein BH20ACI3_BH20ACI3_25660 [soil metagenome]